MAVQISGNDITVPRDGSFTRNVTIGGTLTYEDVTNIDSVGLITARNGIEIGARPGVAASISVDGNAIFSGITTIGSHMAVGGVTPETFGGGHVTLEVAGSTTSQGGVFKTATSDSAGTGSSGTEMILFTDSAKGSINVVSADPLTFSTANTERARIDSSGRLLLGTTTEGVSTADDLTIATSGNTGISIRSGTSINGNLFFSDGTSGNDELRGYLQYDHSSNAMKFGVNASEALRIEANTRVLVGHTDNIVVGGHLARLQIDGTDYNQATVSIMANSNDANGAYLMLGHQRSGAAGGTTILNDGDEVGVIRFAACDGSDIAHATAEIRSEVDGTPGANDMPGRLVFKTTADGGTSKIERMRIDSSGHITKPYQFHIEVDRDSDQTGYNAGANFGTPMIYNRVIRTIGTATSALDTSTGKITVPVAGVYFLEATAYATTAALQQGWFTEGTSRMSYSDHAYDSKTNRIQTVGMHYLAANTEVGYKPYGSGESNVTIGDSIYHTWFRVTLMG